MNHGIRVRRPDFNRSKARRKRHGSNSHIGDEQAVSQCEFSDHWVAHWRYRQLLAAIRQADIPEYIDTTRLVWVSDGYIYTDNHGA